MSSASAGQYPELSPMPSEATQIVTAVNAGDRSALDRLFERIYTDFRRIARRYLTTAGPGITLQPTELVHEAFIKLVDYQRVDWRSESHFFAVGATAMRHILVDYARHKARAKRGGDRRRIPLDDVLSLSIREDEDVLAIDEALKKLGAINETRAKIVELRFFAGMTVAEVAEVLGVSKRTVEAHWTLTRAWLRRELAGDEEEDDT